MPWTSRPRCKKVLGHVLHGRKDNSGFESGVFQFVLKKLTKGWESCILDVFTPALRDVPGLQQALQAPPTSSAPVLADRRVRAQGSSKGQCSARQVRNLSIQYRYQGQAGISSYSMSCTLPQWGFHSPGSESRC